MIEVFREDQDGNVRVIRNFTALDPALRLCKERAEQEAESLPNNARAFFTAQGYEVRITYLCSAYKYRFVPGDPHDEMFDLLNSSIRVEMNKSLYETLKRTPKTIPGSPEKFTEPGEDVFSYQEGSIHLVFWKTGNRFYGQRLTS